MRSAKKQLLHRLLEGYERSAHHGQPGPWKRAVIVYLDERTFPDAWGPDGADEKDELLSAVTDLQRAGAVELRYHKGFGGRIPSQVRLTASTIERALELAVELGFRPAGRLLDDLALHAEGLIQPSLPGWMAEYLALVAAGARAGSTKPLGISVGRLKQRTRRYLDALTAAAHISESAGGMVRIVSERVFAGAAGSVAPSKRLQGIASEVASVLVRADPQWAVRPSRRRDVFAYYGIRSKPTFLQCAGAFSYHAPCGARSLADDTPYASVSDGLVDALASGLASAGDVTVTLIENETPFIVYAEAAGGPAGLRNRNEAVIYTAGFPTPLLRRFLSRAALAGPTLRFRHWGDADPGGLQIWWTIRRAVGREVPLFRMGPEWYEQAAAQGGTPLTSGQRHGLECLRLVLTSEEGSDVQQALRLIDVVLRTGMWVEQERHGS